MSINNQILLLILKLTIVVSETKLINDSISFQTPLNCMEVDANNQCLRCT